jgi:hypothetical protein
VTSTPAVKEAFGTYLKRVNRNMSSKQLAVRLKRTPWSSYGRLGISRKRPMYGTIEFTSAQKARATYRYKNIKLELHKTNAAI